MKKTIITMLLLLVCLAGHSQGQSVETFSISIITDAVKSLVALVNWLFVLVFMLITWLINDTGDATNTKNLDWFARIPKSIRALVIGVVFIALFAWWNSTTSRDGIFKLIMSLMMAMVIYKFGIDRILRYISRKIGLKFE